MGLGSAFVRGPPSAVWAPLVWMVVRLGQGDGQDDTQPKKSSRVSFFFQAASGAKGEAAIDEGGGERKPRLLARPAHLHLYWRVDKQGCLSVESHARWIQRDRGGVKRASHQRRNSSLRSQSQAFSGLTDYSKLSHHLGRSVEGGQRGRASIHGTYLSTCAGWMLIWGLGPGLSRAPCARVACIHSIRMWG